jgi:hypothetical protein
MHLYKLYRSIFRMLFIAAIVPVSIRAQNQPNFVAAAATDTLSRLNPAATQPVQLRPVESQEQILETIRIQAVVEKPSVTLLLKRAETNISPLPFQLKSFEKELNSKPQVIKDFDKKSKENRKSLKIKDLLRKEAKSK